MATPETTGLHPRLLEEGLYALWGHEYNRYEPEWKPVFEQNVSKKAYEDIQGLYGLGMAPEKDEGDAFLYDSGGNGFSHRFTNKTYGQAVAITEEAIEDNLYLNKASYYTKELMKSLVETDENLAANILNRATNASYPGPDGVSLANTAHLYQGGGTYSNLVTATAMSETSFEDLSILINKAKDDRILVRKILAQSVIVPPDLEFTVCRILQSQLQNDTANNAVNVLRFKGKFPGGVHMMRRLTSTTAHFIVTDATYGLMMFDRVSPSFKTWVDDKTGNINLKCRARRSFGFVDGGHAIYYNGGA